MGDIIGGIIGGVGSVVAGNAAAKQALTGYNYLAKNKAVQGEVNAIPGAETGATGALNNQGAALGGQQALLNGGAAQKAAFANYLGSTGYNFQRQQGQSAITGSAASRGLLGSGATAKALTKFGTGLADSNFQNYFNNLGANAQGFGGQAQGFGAQANRGLTAASATGEAGTTGGGNAAGPKASGINGLASGIMNVFGV